MYEIKEDTESLIEAIKKSSVYREYDKQRKKINKDPELKRRINEYRVEVFRLQNSNEDVSRQMEELVDRNADFLEDSTVSAFLDADSSLCKMLQQITDRIIKSIDFE